MYFFLDYQLSYGAGAISKTLSDFYEKSNGLTCGTFGEFVTSDCGHAWSCVDVDPFHFLRKVCEEHAANY